MVWNVDMKFSKKGPTDEELKEIEHDISTLDINEGFEPKNNKGVTLTTEEIEEKAKKLTKYELKMIDEMVRIIEDPNYISDVRRRRMEEAEDVDSISFDEDSLIQNLDGFGSHDDEFYL
jgi:hypothetical protein